MANSRIAWIDATKGLLILLMVFGHISNIAGNHGVQNVYLIKCLFFSSLYACFFMQAFLILTGYTSNFDKPAKEFFFSLVKTVLVPWFSFSIISQIFRMLNGEGEAFLTINNQKFFFLIEDYWFLHVLFFGKIIYFVIYKIVKNDSVRGLLLLVMMIGGFSIFALYSDSEQTYHYLNYIHYKDTLCMTFFLWVGNFCRRKNVFDLFKGKYLLIIIALYLFGHALRVLFKMKGFDELMIEPVIISHGGNAVSPLQIPAYLYYVILGSFVCFGLMQYLKKCSVMEYLGKNSLVVYCAHFVFLNLFVELVNEIISPDNIFSAVLYTVLVLILCLLSCFAVIYLTRFKPFRCLIGKF